MADKLRWGIIATGRIAHDFARGIKASKTGSIQSVGSRTEEAAKKFTDEHGGNPYGSYQAVLDDPNVDAVYIATPHHMHEEWTIKAAEAGKGILCEKPFTLNALEAETALAAVKANDVFFMEAFMYRCHPQTHKVKELVRGGTIGKLLNMNLEFGFGAPEDWTNFRANGAVGGGGLMDVGAYCVSMARLLAGEDPSEAHYAADITRGYDAQGSGCMKFPSNVTAHFACGIHANLSNDVRIYGSDGMIVVDQPWKCGGGQIHVRAKGKDEQTFTLNSGNDDLYAIEADAVAQFFEAKECPYMTPADTLGQMLTLDRLRQSAGLTFAAERRA